MIGISFDREKSDIKKVIMLMISILVFSALTLALMYNSISDVIREGYLLLDAYFDINYTFNKTIDIIKPSVLASASILASAFLLAIRYAFGRWKLIHISGAIITAITTIIFLTNTEYAFIPFPMLLLNSNLSFFALLSYISRIYP